VAILNLDLFKQFGVDPPVNGRWTWPEFLQKMQALTRKDSSGRQCYGLVTNLGTMEYEAYSIIFNAGGRILKKNSSGEVVSALMDPPFIKGLHRLVDLEYKYKVCRPGTGAMTQEQSWNVWRDEGTCAVSFQGAWCITAARMKNEAIERQNEQMIRQGRTGDVRKPMKWTIAAVPGDDENSTPVLGSSGLGTYVLFKKGDRVKRDLSAAFIKMLTSGEGQRVLKDENVFPSRKSTGNLWANDPVLGPVFELFPAGVMSPLIPGGERVDSVLQPEIQKALLVNPSTGKPQSSPEEAARAADAKVRAVIQRARRRFGNLDGTH
jgi:multiple sugar transport system substrate-binding protein